VAVVNVVNDEQQKMNGSKDVCQFGKNVNVGEY